MLLKLKAKHFQPVFSTDRESYIYCESRRHSVALVAPVASRMAAVAADIAQRLLRANYDALPARRLPGDNTLRPATTMPSATARTSPNNQSFANSAWEILHLVVMSCQYFFRTEKHFFTSFH